MVFSKPIIPLATMLLAAQLVVAGRGSDMTEEDLTFVKAPLARGPEVSSWLASKAAAAKPTIKPATKTSNKAPARRTAEAELEFDGEVLEAEHSVSVAVVPTPTPTAADVDEDEDSEEASSHDADADEEVTKLYARFNEEPSARSGRIIAKSRIVDEDASPFLDEAEDPEDGSWAKRDRPAGGAGYSGGQGKPAGQDQGQGYGGGQGQGMGPGGKQGGGMGQGQGGRGSGQGKGAHQEGGGKGGKQDYGNNMKRLAPNHGPRNGTTTDRPQRPKFAPSGVRPSGTKPTGSMPAGAGSGYGGPGGKGPRPTTTVQRCRPHSHPHLVRHSSLHTPSTAWTAGPDESGKWTIQAPKRPKPTHPHPTLSWTAPDHSPSHSPNTSTLHMPRSEAAADDYGTACAASSEKVLSYISYRCNGRRIVACCPRGYQDALGEDCVQMPRCKRDPKDGGKTPMREWEGVLPFGAKNCGKVYTANSFFYGVCVQGDGLPENMKNGKCTGYGGNLCL